ILDLFYPQRKCTLKHYFMLRKIFTFYVKTTHYVSDSVCPRWECSVEMLVQDVASVCITFVVCSLPKNPKLQDGELLGIHTLNLSTEKCLRIYSNEKILFAKQILNNIYNTLTSSIVFRCVSSVAGCSNLVPENPNFKGMPLPMPLASGSPAGSPCLITSSSPNIGPSVSPTRLTSSPQFSSIRRGSTGVLDIEEPHKKRGNTHWLHQAKTFLGSVHDHDGVRRQDVGDILASGLGLLELTIVRATDLVAKDLNGFSDPYCVVKVNGEVKYRTRIKKKTLDPYWNEKKEVEKEKEEEEEPLRVTLWDHDAFGMKDFLGSLSLKEEEVRTFSASLSSVWCKLDGVKSGSIEVKFKLISEDFEFERGSRCTSSVSNIEISKKTSSEDTEPTTSRTSSIDSGSSKCFGDKLEQANTPFLNGTPKNFTLSLPNRSHSRPIYGNKVNALKHSTLLRASSNPTLGCYHSPSKEKEENYYIRSRIGPLCTPSRTRKSGAEIIASALALAQAKSGSPFDEHNEVKLVKDLSNKATFRNKPIQSTSINGNFEPLRHPAVDTQFELESIQPIEKFRKVEDLEIRERLAKEDAKDVPKISLNDQSEDEYGLTDGSGDEFIDKTKPRSKRKGRRTLKAVKDKLLGCIGTNFYLRLSIF
ncbi:Protein piccolo, partial [Armadillidium vulgare]